MKMQHAIVCLLGGLTLATHAGPASAQPVTFQVDLLYEKIVDGPRPRTVVRLAVPVGSSQAAEVMCGSPMKILKLGRNALGANPGALGLSGNWMAGGGSCVMGQDGNIELTGEARSGGSN